MLIYMLTIAKLHAHSCFLKSREAVVHEDFYHCDTLAIVISKSLLVTHPSAGAPSSCIFYPHIDNSSIISCPKIERVNGCLIALLSPLAY